TSPRRIGAAANSPRPPIALGRMSVWGERYEANNIWITYALDGPPSPNEQAHPRAGRGGHESQKTSMPRRSGAASGSAAHAPHSPTAGGDPDPPPASAAPSAAASG